MDIDNVTRMNVTLRCNHYLSVTKSEGHVHVTKVILAAHSRQVSILKDHIHIYIP